jgi:hypothetical protein
MRIKSDAAHSLTGQNQKVNSLFTAECAEHAENIIKTDFLAYVFLGALCVLGGSWSWFQWGIIGVKALSAFIGVPFVFSCSPAAAR